MGQAVATKRLVHQEACLSGARSIIRSLNRTGYALPGLMQQTYMAGALTQVWGSRSRFCLHEVVHRLVSGASQQGCMSKAAKSTVLHST